MPRPRFGLATKLSSVLDIAAVGLIGTKTGLSTPHIEQLEQILRVTAQALSEVSSRRFELSKQKSDQEAVGHSKRVQMAELWDQILRGGKKDIRLDDIAGTGLISELGGGWEPMDEEKDLDAPRTSWPSVDGNAPSVFFIEKDARLASTPIIVVQGFQDKSAKTEILWQPLASWAHEIASSGIAHTIFVTDHASSSKLLQQSLASPYNAQLP